MLNKSEVNNKENQKKTEASLNPGLLKKEKQKNSGKTLEEESKDLKFFTKINTIITITIFLFFYLTINKIVIEKIIDLEVERRIMRGEYRRNFIENKTKEDERGKINLINCEENRTGIKNEHRDMLIKNEKKITKFCKFIKQFAFLDASFGEANSLLYEFIKFVVISICHILSLLIGYIYMIKNKVVKLIRNLKKRIRKCLKITKIYQKKANKVFILCFAMVWFISQILIGIVITIVDGVKILYWLNKVKNKSKGQNEKTELRIVNIQNDEKTSKSCIYYYKLLVNNFGIAIDWMIDYFTQVVILTLLFVGIFYFMIFIILQKMFKGMVELRKLTIRYKKII